MEFTENSTFSIIITINSFILPIIAAYVISIKTLKTSKTYDLNSKILFEFELLYIEKIDSNKIIFNTPPIDTKWKEEDRPENIFNEIDWVSNLVEKDIKYLLSTIKTPKKIDPEQIKEGEIKKYILNFRNTLSNARSNQNTLEKIINFSRERFYQITEKAYDKEREEHKKRILKEKTSKEIFVLIRERSYLDSLAKDNLSIYILSCCQFVIGIFIPFLCISTLGLNTKQFKVLSFTYDMSVFVGLTIGTLSLLPYAVFIGLQTGKVIRRRTPDTPNT